MKAILVFGGLLLLVQLALAQGGIGDWHTPMALAPPVQVVPAQGGLAVRVVSAKVVPNPKPAWSRDYKAPDVLQLEVVGTDRSGADSVEPRDKDIALYDCNGQPAARYLYHIEDGARNFPDEGRKEVRSKLMFSVPEGPKQQYLLRWTVTRYARMATSFTWTGLDLEPPLEQERDGITVSVDELKLGRGSAADIAGWQTDEAKAGKMATDHLILTLRSSGLRHDSMNVMGVNAVEVSTGADGQRQYGDPGMDCCDNRFSGYPADGTAGKLYLMTANTTCHFLDTTTIPKITKLTITVSRDIPFDEGWAPVAFDQ